MIKLIASDLDGTLLLNGAQKLSSNACELIHKLTEMGIVFIASSGRQYANLRRLFAPIKDEIGYICENGCMAFYKGKKIYKEVMDDDIAKRLMKAIWDTDTAEILLSGEDTSYIQPKDPDYLILLRDVVKNNVTLLEDIFEKREDYFKISIYEKSGLGAAAQIWQERFGKELKVVTSGNEWLDCMPLGVDKGIGIKRIQKYLGISPDECLAFGDNYNDVEMLENVKYNFVMDTAPQDIKNTSKYITHTVEEVLEQIIQSNNTIF